MSFQNRVSYKPVPLHSSKTSPSLIDLVKPKSNLLALTPNQNASNCPGGVCSLFPKSTTTSTMESCPGGVCPLTPTKPTLSNSQNDFNCPGGVCPLVPPKLFTQKSCPGGVCPLVPPKSVATTPNNCPGGVCPLPSPVKINAQNSVPSNCPGGVCPLGKSSYASNLQNAFAIKLNENFGANQYGFNNKQHVAAFY